MALHGTTQRLLVILAVEDLVRSVQFYDAVFGWERVVEAPVYVEYRLPDGSGVGLYSRAGFERNSGLGALPTPSGRSTSTELYLYVDNPALFIERLREMEAVELSPLSERDWGDEAAYFTDPDGNLLVIARSM